MLKPIVSQYKGDLEIQHILYKISDLMLYKKPSNYFKKYLNL